MKNLIYIVIIFAFASHLSGQSTIEPAKESKRSNCLIFNALLGKTKTGVGVRYKSLYHINEILKVGWGLGIDSYSSDFRRNFVPVSVDLRGDVNLNGRSPFYMISIGYGIALAEEDSFAEKARGGLMVDLSLGYRSKKYTSQPFIAIGYRLQNAYYSGLDDYGNENKDVIYKRWAISAGILF